MSFDLYFLGILARALSPGATRERVQQALLEIERLGTRPGFRRGRMQWRRFLSLIAVYVHDLATAAQGPIDYDLLVALVAGALDDDTSAPTLARAHLQWWLELENLIAEDESLRVSPPSPCLILTQDGRVRLRAMLSPTPARHLVRGVGPGHYTLTMETGRVLWDQALTQRDLIWHQAFPGQPLELAADSGQAAHMPGETQVLSFLDGLIEVCVLAGVENGQIELRSGAFPEGDQYDT